MRDHSRSPAWSVAALLCALVTGCGHGHPFSAGPFGSDRPLQPGPAARLTYSAGRDQQPTWLPTGDAILYSFERLDETERSWCLGELPGTGGSRSRTICDPSPPAAVTEAFTWPAASPDGRLAFVRAVSPPHALVADRTEIVIGRLADPVAGTVIATVPFTPSGGLTLGAVAQLAWLDSASLVLRGDRVFAGSPCKGCPADTIASGRLLVRAFRRQSSWVLEPLPGTDYATSVTTRGDPDEIFFTRGGDPRVYRRVLSSGVTTVVWNFAGAGIARDIGVAGSRLVAVVGGSVAFGYSDALADSAQADAGGVVHVVDLAVVNDQALSWVPVPLRHLALSPDGRRVVGETGARAPDLWLVELP